MHFLKIIIEINLYKGTLLVAYNFAISFYFYRACAISFTRMDGSRCLYVNHFSAPLPLLLLE